MRKIIVNSTPLIILCKIGQLEILKKLYGEIFIPQAVYKEITAKSDLIKTQINNAAKEWIKIKAIQNHDDKKMYKAKLHDGEVEVMILAQEQKADLVIIDDNAAKKTAKYLQLPVTGTLGVLIKAKMKGIIPNVLLIIEEMERNHFYINKEIKNMVLKAANEI